MTAPIQLSTARPPLALRWRLGKLLKYRDLPRYWWVQKRRFGVTNTKFDISFCVFRESFVRDQYGIRAFLDRIGAADRLCFVDVGRNHGLVFYYAMYHIMRSGFRVKTVDYYGIDPSPLKFVYFNFHDWLTRVGVRINYHIVDRAVVFDGERQVSLKYGERNFGNFHIEGSNFAQKSDDSRRFFENIDIVVDTMQFDELKEIVAANLAADAMIVKIDCKHRTDHMFAEILDMLTGKPLKYLLTAEADGSSARDLSRYEVKGERVLSTSQVGA